MVNNLVRVEFPIQNSFHDNPMFLSVFFRAICKPCINPDIPISVDVFSSFPSWRFFPAKILMLVLKLTSLATSNTYFGFRRLACKRLFAGETLFGYSSPFRTMGSSEEPTSIYSHAFHTTSLSRTVGKKGRVNPERLLTDDALFLKHKPIVALWTQRVNYVEARFLWAT